MTRRAALALIAGASRAQTTKSTGEEAARLVLDASRALQARRAGRFLGYFEKSETPEFARFRENVLALSATREIASSVRIEKVAVEEEAVRLQVDWLLQLTPLEQPGAVEHRQALVEILVRGKKIASFSAPDGFLAPPRVSP